MLAPSGELLRVGLSLKLNQFRRAVRAYLRDRTRQASDKVSGYAAAAALFAAAGIFLIAALLVGVAALFRWVEINYGPFWAFGAIGALLVAISAICAGIAVRKLNRPPQRFPSLGSRLAAAVRSSPIPILPQAADAAKELAASIPLAPATPTGRDKSGIGAASGSSNRNLQLALVAGATLLGWAMMRRRRQARQFDA